MRGDVETCTVVDQHCLSPANLSPRVAVRASCFKCGQPVCVNCSSRRRYMSYGIVRLCNDCQVELDGNDRIVMARIARMSGH